jgi:tryptophanyl-tRNA synthetase
LNRNYRPVFASQPSRRRYLNRLRKIHHLCYFEKDQRKDAKRVALRQKTLKTGFSMRILSGIQPSGALHIGNYLGAIQQYIALQHGNQAYYFVADYHALTSVRNAETLRGFVRDVLLDLLALGLEPEKATVFVQSDVPETVELAWLLTSVTPMGWLEKCVSYKDKIAQGIPAEHGLFAYPVLQAADILLYDADVVPVGQDQKQHLEITRDIAERFNNVYGKSEPVFKLPDAKILPSVAVVPGLDGRKMSKSYGNTIEIFDEPKTIEKKCKRIVTDSTPMADPKNPESCPVFNLLKLFATEEETQQWDVRYRAGGMGYGDVKKRLAELIIERFAPARDLRAQWAADPVKLAEVRQAGAERARKTARIVLDRARNACGLG